MSDINIRVTGKAGRITLTRGKALNALSYDMCMAIDTALRQWASDDAVKLVVIDAEGEKAFCAGGDIAELYDTGTAGDYAYGRKFWSDEYRLNALIFEYPKPVVSFLQGFTMGGGVGIGYSQHSGQVLCCDGTLETDERIRAVLTNDPGTGVMRHADAGYQIAIDCAKEQGLNLPMIG